MARQFSGRLTREALKAQLDGAVSVSFPAEAPSPTGPGTDEQQIIDWLARLHLLQGVPFNYLVPDAGMLPAESIRFFQVDNNWLAALLDGAYSIGFAAVSQQVAGQARPPLLARSAGRAQRGEARQAMLHQVRSRLGLRLDGPQQLLTDAPANGPVILSGFLLRSAVVAGWPGLEVFGYADAAGRIPLPIVRFEVVAPSLVLCLFSGVVAQVTFREPCETVHFGLDASSPNWLKTLRYATDSPTVTVGSYMDTSVSVPMRNTAGGAAIISLAALASSMASQVWPTPAPAGTSFTAAQFALEMVAGGQVVTFQVSTPA